jgi:hypothetical protein
MGEMMNRTVSLWFVALSLVATVGCGSKGSSGGTGSGGTNGGGICKDTCLKDCNTDNDCDVTMGQLCCKVSGVGNACVAAAQCPRACTTDNMCSVSTGEACLKIALQLPDRYCSQPQAGVKGCSTDNDCASNGDKCCGIYSSKICLPPNECPKICTMGTDCNTSLGEVCCTTINKIDPTVTASGLCLSPNLFPCPRTCNTSSDCQTQNGELCCNGICSTTCAKTCQTSNDCTGQLCCKNALANINITLPGGYPVTSTGAGGVGGGGGAGGVGGGGAGGGLGGAGGVGGATGTGGTGVCPTGDLCGDTCNSGNGFPGVCDDGAFDSATDVCAYGTDFSDCGPRVPGNCTNTCATAANFVCEDGGTGSTASTCARGTDCFDCGVR